MVAKCDLLVCSSEWREDPGFDLHESIPVESFEIDFEDFDLRGSKIKPMFGFKIWVSFYTLQNVRKNAIYLGTVVQLAVIDTCF